LGRRTCLVIMDEAHQAVAPTYNHLLRLLVPSPSNPLLGLSATPGRTCLRSGEVEELAEFFCRQKVRLGAYGEADPVSFLQRQGFLAATTYVPLPYYNRTGPFLTPAEREQLEHGFDLPSRIVADLGADTSRNLLILQNIISESKDNSSIIVFACSVDHAQMLSSVLRLRGVSAEVLTSQTPEDRRRQIVRDFKNGSGAKVLVNFGILTTGFDAPNARVAIVARPTQSVVLYSQMVGRVMRGPRAGGNERCRVLTVVDQIPGFRSASEGFGYWDDLWTTPAGT